MHRRLAMLLALLALLLQSATASAHGLLQVSRTDGTAIALCTPYGVKIIQVDADGAPASPGPHGGDDCGLCLHAGCGHALAPLPFALPVVVALVAADMPAPVPFQAAAPYRAQNPRGPPGRQ